jgi:hypothetical protein
MTQLDNDIFTIRHIVDETDQVVCFDIVLFKKKEKLRSHTYKHFFDEKEFLNVWRRFTGKTLENISQARSYLEQISCPASYNTSMACENNCPVFAQCTYILDEFEKEYITCIQQVIHDSAETPLFSTYESSRVNGQQALSFLSRHTVVAKVVEINTGVFNLATCYASNRENESYPEFRDKIIKRIRSEAARSNITWFSKNSWGLVKRDIKIDPKKKSGKKKIAPYKRGGSGNYKQYLDDF